MNTEELTMTIKSLPTPSAWICIWCCVYSRIWCGESVVGREARRSETLLGRVHCPGHCTRASASGSGWDRQQGRQLDQRRRDFRAHALHQEEPAACNTPRLPSRRHFSLVVRRFPHCLLQEQQQSAIDIKCATQVLLCVMEFILVSLICISCWFGCILGRFF